KHYRIKICSTVAGSHESDFGSMFFATRYQLHSAGRIILSRSDKRIDTRLAASLEQSKIQTNKSLLLLSLSTATILTLLLGSLYLLHENLKHQRQAALVIEHDRETTVEKYHYLEAEVSDRLEELERVKSSLEEEVARRTTELKTELERTKQLNSFMIERELRIKALKDEIAELKGPAKQ
ncbi:hypothetical protein H7Y63_03215, partial [Polaromonas sp.]|nr:hypothetical protein [Candidatus Saccharibacteria bacterium]